MSTVVKHDGAKHDGTGGLNSLLVGRSVVRAEVRTTRFAASVGTLLLDDGTVLEIVGNEGCGGCPGGWFEVEALNDFDNRIMRVKVVEFEDGLTADSEHKMVFEIFVYGAGAKPMKHSLGRVAGSLGSGYYGAGFTLRVVERDQ